MPSSKLRYFDVCFPSFGSSRWQLDCTRIVPLVELRQGGLCEG
jgi:hypothetical protein